MRPDTYIKDVISKRLTWFETTFNHCIDAYSRCFKLGTGMTHSNKFKDPDPSFYKFRDRNDTS